MKRRLTARVLLFDPAGRILLMKGRLPGRAVGAWFTIGGGAEPGEDVLQTAAREIVEETGLTDAALGPIVWRREGVLTIRGEPVFFDEYYVVARTAGGEPVRHGWQSDEHHLIDEIRWWTRDELAVSDERVFPPGLASRLGDILDGRYPAEPLRIPWD